MRYTGAILALSGLLFLSACAEAQYAAHLWKQIPDNGTSASQGTFKVGNPYKVSGRYYTPEETYNFTQTGIASWYGPDFHGKHTANGEVFDKRELTAAHKTLQMPSLIRVTNLENGRAVILRVNDRGPFAHGRILDVSERAAELLDFKMKGTAKIRLDVLPAESRKIAEIAKQGHDTGGYEIAMNRPAATQPASAPTPSTLQTQPATFQTASVQPVEAQALEPVSGHAAPDGRFMPDPVVKHVPVGTSRIYVQAGSFSVEDNALALSQKLASHGPSKVYLTRVDGRPFYRVRLGPFDAVEQADATLTRLVQNGNNSAIIVVD